MNSGNIFDYLASLSEIEIGRLYSNCVWSCRSVFQSLPPLAKQYVMRLLCTELRVTREALAEWVDPSFATMHRAAVAQLLRSSFLLEDVDAGTLRLNPDVQRTLQRALAGGLESPWRGKDKKGAGHVVSPAVLARDARQQWERVLFFMVRPPGDARGFREERAAMQHVIELLYGAELLRDGGDEGDLLTQSGFEFVLLERSLQLWILTRQRIEGLQATARVPADSVLGFLFRLGSCEVGHACRVKKLDEHERQLLPAFAELGLLVRREKYFYPTPLASVLVFGDAAAGGGGPGLAEGAGGSGGGEESEPELGLVVETNFKVYAFTTSELHAHLLRFFVEVEYRLPNLVVGEITRESAQNAFRSGITAERIIHFLNTHAHERVQGRSPLTPDNVTDQLRLWAKENNRFRSRDAVLYSNFDSLPEFEAARRHASDLHALLWSSTESQKFCVTEAGHTQLADFLRARKKRKQPG